MISAKIFSISLTPWVSGNLARSLAKTAWMDSLRKSYVLYSEIKLVARSLIVSELVYAPLW